MQRVSGRLLRDRLVCGNRHADDERFAQKAIGVPFLPIAFSRMQRPKVRLLQRSFERTALDTALEPQFNSFVEAASRIVGIAALRSDADRRTDGDPTRFR